MMLPTKTLGIQQLAEWRRGESNPGRRGLAVNHGPRKRAPISSGYPRSTRQVPSFGHRVPKTSALDLYGGALRLFKRSPPWCATSPGALKGSAKGGIRDGRFQGRLASAGPIARKRG